MNGTREWIGRRRCAPWRSGRIAVLAAAGLVVGAHGAASAVPAAASAATAPMAATPATPAAPAKPSAKPPARPAATAAKAPAVELVPNVGVLEGTFDNARQMAAVPPGTPTKPTPGKAWVDAQYARFVRFEAPLLGEIVYYMEWRAGAPDAALTRQRVWAFSGTKTANPRMRFYTLDSPGLWSAAAKDPALLAPLSRAGLHEYPAGCELQFARRSDGRLEGRIPPDACRITARETKRTMTIDAAIVLGRDGFVYDEAGTLDDGRKAFVVPEGFRYEFDRVR